MARRADDARCTSLQTEAGRIVVPIGMRRLQPIRSHPTAALNRTMSNVQSFKPAPLLAPYINSIWVYEGLTADSQHPWIQLPDTSTYICFQHGDPVRATHKNGTYTARSGLSGFQSHRFTIDSAGPMSGVTVCLTAWGLNAFLGDAVEACTDIRVENGDLFSRAFVHEVEERLFYLTNAEAKARLVEEFLLKQLLPRKEDDLIRQVCMKLNSVGGMYPVHSLANDFGISERSLERKFLRFIGATPKKYARILRLRCAINLRKQIPSWAEIAQFAGYYDQSHLIRDCRDIYGDSPENLFPMPISTDFIRRNDAISFSARHGGRIHREHLLILLRESCESL